jgi:glycosyltransferase involved in cell wall biosynthesis
VRVHHVSGGDALPGFRPVAPMKIAHVGPALARRGGSSGYLRQLAEARAAARPGSHSVTFPAAEPPPPATSGPSPLRRIRSATRRALLGPPKFYRPSGEDLSRPGGAIDTLLRESLRASCVESSASIDAARDARPDVFFTHDPAVAEAMLARRGRGQQVWLMIHSPMPIALYLAWAFGVPEWEWTALVALPDLRRWIDWELDIWSKVDRLITPCQEGLAELARVDARFASFRDVEFLLTGANGPARVYPAEPADALRRRWRLSANEPVGLFLGSAQPYRGLAALIAAVDLLPARVRGVIAIAGPPRDGALRHPRLKWLGPVREISDLLAAVDFVVNVNVFNLFDLSIIEAAEAARPFLLHASGGNQRFAALGVGCRTVSNLEPATIAHGLTALFTMDPAERLQLGAKSRDVYRRELTPASMWARHTALYDRAAAAALQTA